MKRVIVAINVPDDWEVSDVAEVLEPAVAEEMRREGLDVNDPDATAWLWHRFWEDVADGTVGRDRDVTQRERRVAP